MSYYIIPKNKVYSNLNLKQTNNISLHISYSLILYMSEVYNELSKLNEINVLDNDTSANNVKTINNITIDFLNKLVNPYEFIYTTVPNSSLSVCKIKSEPIFFELIEIFKLFDINNAAIMKKNINIANFTQNPVSVNYFINILRENQSDYKMEHCFIYNEIFDLAIKTPFDDKFELMIFEFNQLDYFDIKQYIKNLLLALLIIIRNQTDNGIAIIKMDNILYKPMIDVIYILSSIYEKVYLIKPSISNSTKSDRFLVCKSLDRSFVTKTNLLEQFQEKITKALSHNNEEIIGSILDNELPFYFINKIEETNAILGQQQLESLTTIINIYNSKNRLDKIETIQKKNIQKSIQWCEKHSLPHNIFIDKLNRFLITNTNTENEIRKNNIIGNSFGNIFGNVDSNNNVIDDRMFYDNIIDDCVIDININIINDNVNNDNVNVNNDNVNVNNNDNNDNNDNKT